ncbi:MAG: oligopeptide transporter, OPT family, partial [Verrucomicrobia bacterium]|nr:oligopeptide transporter, OPT family [Verrucomicrobiota bacterium]
MRTEKQVGSEPAFHSYISAHTTMREFTPRALIVGTLLGMVFGASSLYLVLKVGLTVSASIPVAVISLALFRLWSKVGGRDATILENNIVQTTGSAGESIAFGLGVTMPAIMILGFDLEITRVMLVAVLGGMLGILMMIPLRRALIVAEHGKLKYPEGTACAAVLMAGANAESRAMASSEALRAAEMPGRTSSLSAKAIFTGFGIGLAYKTLMSAFKLWKDIPEKIFGAPLKGGSVAAEISPELLGVGYIIGPRIASIMVAGGVLNALVLIPLITFFGEGYTGVLAPGTAPIGEMSVSAIRGSYILYIGAGAVAAGGIISLVRSLPTIVHGIRAGLADFKRAAAAHSAVIRTERDLSMKVVAVGIVVLIAAILAAPALHMNPLGAILIVVFGFLFVTVSSRLTGEIGSSSNPISGMTVATLLLTCLIFLIVGWTGGTHYVTALS